MGDANHYGTQKQLDLQGCGVGIAITSDEVEAYHFQFTKMAQEMTGMIYGWVGLERLRTPFDVPFIETGYPACAMSIA